MATTAELDRAVSDQLAVHDLRYTAVRRRLVDELRRSDGPVTLPQILESATDLAQSSAYRNLSLLEEAGIVRRLVHGGDHAHFELAEELTDNAKRIEGVDVYDRGTNFSPFAWRATEDS